MKVPQLSLIEELTMSLEDFNTLSRESMDKLLSDARSYAQSVSFGLGDFTPETREHALEDACRLSAHIERAEQLWKDLKESESQAWSDQAEGIAVNRLIIGTEQKLRLELLSMFYLHRELEVLHKLVPRAAGKIKQENTIKRVRAAGTAANAQASADKRLMLETAVGEYCAPLKPSTWSPAGCLTWIRQRDAYYRDGKYCGYAQSVAERYIRKMLRERKSQ